MDPSNDKLPADESLDELIGRALEVPADGASAERLESFWWALSAQERRRRRTRWIGAVACAASIAVAVLLATMSNRSGNGQHRQARVEHVTPPVAEEAGSHDTYDGGRDGAEVPSRSAGRAPTSYERFVFLARTGATLPAAGPTMGQQVSDLIVRLVEAPTSDAGELLSTAGLNSRDVEVLLLRRLPRATDANAEAIVRLLAVCGTREAVPSLLAVARRESLRDDVLAAVERIVGPQRLAEVVPNTGNEEVRRELIERLLSADSEIALRGYLSLVASDTTRSDALAVANELPARSIGRLLGLLDDDEEPVRLAAAIVLGSVNGPEVTRSLIARVTSQPAGSVEAWIALLGCRGEMAQEFLSYAMQRPRLLGYVNNARLRWAQMIP